MKVCFIGDLHLDNQTPVSRLDDYRLLTLEKLDKLLDICKKENLKYVIFTGDFFNRLDVPISYLNEVINVFVQFKLIGVEVYTIVGNHDLPYKKFEFFKNTALNLLFATGLVKRLDKLEFIEYSTIITGLHFSKEVEPPKPYLYNVLVAHYAFDNTVPGESLSTKSIQGYNLTVFGHDHQPYKPLTVDNTLVLRPGSFTRRTKDTYNLSREIILYVLDLESKEYKEIVLPTKPSVEVFKSEVFNEYDEEYNQLSVIFKEDFFKSETADLLSIVDGLGIMYSDEVKNTVKQYFISRGYKNE